MTKSIVAKTWSGITTVGGRVYSDPARAPIIASAILGDAPGTLTSVGSLGSVPTTIQVSATLADSPTTLSSSGTLNVTSTMTEAQAARLLNQATMGTSLSSLSAATGQTYDAWFADQATKTPSTTLAQVTAGKDFLARWCKGAVQGPDQLRQRMAYALSQILIVSTSNMTLGLEARSIASFWDMLVNGALGNYRTLLENVSKHPAMGIFLSHWKNEKPDPVTGRHADENYAREIMQLFSVGLVELNMDGTVKLSGGNPIPTYTQAHVEGAARVFTGWGSAPANYASGSQESWMYDNNLWDPMIAFQTYHDTDSKFVIGNNTLPAGRTAQQDLTAFLDILFAHPNVAPFISKALIQLLICSNPSPAYVERVATVFADNGSGVRGDLLAVAKAIFTDVEARTPHTTGKLREPVMKIVNLWRAFDAADPNGEFEDPLLKYYMMYNLAQQPMSSPSVFNFYRPDYVRAGPIKNAGLVCPEFQITNEKYVCTVPNMIQRLAYNWESSTGVKNGDPNYGGNPEVEDVLCKTAAWESLAANSANLIDKLNTVLMQGLMPTAMRTSLINYSNGISSGTPWARAIETASLIINSAQYTVQR